MQFRTKLVFIGQTRLKCQGLWGKKGLQRSKNENERPKKRNKAKNNRTSNPSNQHCQKVP